ncbi:MAG TPA: GNAT family N-acetyltransferase [Pyrinomonadaceae bacterium]|nr:GNAT family N-acetyltransferase [Pyrinomonadaceae bacterium]
MRKPEAITIVSEDPTTEDPLRLTRALTVELSDMYQDDGGANSFDPNDAIGVRSIFVVARLSGEAIGCGAIRPLDVETAEVKRMYVVPHARRMGIGARILDELESAARNMGYQRLRLETGLRQPEAIALYEAAGFAKVNCYGNYTANPMSVCFEKELDRQLN